MNQITVRKELLLNLGNFSNEKIVVEITANDNFENLWKVVETCSANSLVGVRIRDCIPFPLSAFFIIPAANARVFPEPVEAAAITSFPSRISGIDFSCISVGSSNFCS